MAGLTKASRYAAACALMWLAAAAAAQTLAPPPLPSASQVPSNPPIPTTGNAGGNISSGNVTRGESAEALEEQAKAKMRAGRYEEAIDVLKQAMQSTLDPSLRSELDKLSLQAQVLENQPSQPQQTNQAPQQSMQERLNRYERNEAAKQQAYLHGATLDRDLVGTWESDPAYPMIGGRLTLTISPDGVYTWVQGNIHDTGKIQAMNTRVTMVTSTGKRLSGAFRILGLAPTTFGPKGVRLQLAFFTGQQFFLTRNP